MGGLVAWLFIGYILLRSKGHWGELLTFAGLAVFFWWLLRVLAGIALAVFGVRLLAYLFTR
jgi:hypothetical protein